MMGQEQDDLSLTFNAIESYVGQITLLQLWSRVLLAREVQDMNSVCRDFSGTILAWPQFRFALNGAVHVEDFTFCAGRCL